MEKREHGGWLVDVLDRRTPLEVLADYGSLPLPPYMGRKRADADDQVRYQTAFASEPGAVAAPSGADADATPRTDIRGSVLYVEDNASNRALVEALLATRPNVQLRIASDGRMGLQLAAAQRPDVALIDISLPDMNGLQLLAQLRRLPHFGNVACIAVSANALTHEIELAIRAGFDDYWTKPLQATRFLRALDQLLERRDGPSST